MRRSIQSLVLAACLIAGGCASANMAGGGTTKTYPVDINIVVAAATSVFTENNLDIEDKAWTSDSSFVLTGYIRSAQIRIEGEAAPVNAVRVFIDRVDAQTSKVRVMTSAQDSHVMASSADRRNDEAEWFFSRLDAKLG